MKNLLRVIRSHPARFFLVLFLLMILSAVLLYPLAASDSRFGMGFFLALIILANAATLFS